MQKEQYLKSFMPRKNRSLFAQLRFGILPLRIETGRFRNTKDTQTGQMRKLKPEERLCEICNSNEIEDEIHFVCRCTQYLKQRNILYNVVQQKLPDFALFNDEQKFKHLMLNEYMLTSAFISDIWTIRSNMLYN